MPVNEVSVKSSIASAMGARISVTGPGRGMYLVTGDGTSLESLVKKLGGEIVLRFNGGKMLATLPFTSYLALKGNSRVSHIGPVSVDVKRLAKMSEMLAKAIKPKANNNG